MYVITLVAKFKVKLGLLLWSKKSHTSMPSVFVMKTTPGRVGEKEPQVLWAWFTEVKDLKIG